MTNRNRNREPASGQTQRPESYTVQSEKGPELRPELVDAEARNEATLWCYKGVNKTQLRRFYGEAMSERRRMQSDNQAKVTMALLKAKAHYAGARDRKNKVLADFFGHHAGLVSTKGDFMCFMQHFEAAVAYHRFFEEKGTNSDDR